DLALLDAVANEGVTRLVIGVLPDPAGAGSVTGAGLEQRSFDLVGHRTVLLRQGPSRRPRGGARCDRRQAATGLPGPPGRCAADFAATRATALQGRLAAAGGGGPMPAVLPRNSARQATLHSGPSRASGPCRRLSRRRPSGRAPAALEALPGGEGARHL